jgi:hypothetical protein
VSLFISRSEDQRLLYEVGSNVAFAVRDKNILPHRRSEQPTVSRYAALPHSPAIAASLATVFMLRAVPSPAAGMRSFERPIPSG